MLKVETYKRDIKTRQRAADIASLRAGDSISISAADIKKASREAGLDPAIKKPKSAVKRVDDIHGYEGFKPAASVEVEDLLTGPKPFEVRDSTLLTKLKSLPATCLCRITAHPFISVGSVVVIALVAFVYAVNKKAAQEADTRNTQDEDDDHIGDIVE